MNELHREIAQRVRNSKSPAEMADIIMELIDRLELVEAQLKNAKTVINEAYAAMSARDDDRAYSFLNNYEEE